MKKSALLVLAMLTIGVAGCSTGNQALLKETPQTLTAKLKKGVTTKEEVQKMFGPANSTGMELGREVWNYVATKGSPMDFVPLPGASTFGDHKTGGLQIEFDKRGRVYQYNFSNAKM